MAAVHQQDDYVAKLRRAMVQAICDVSAPDDASTTGDHTRYIGATEVCEALTSLLAEFLEGGPGLETPRDIRAVSDAIAKKLRLGIAEIRALRAETGSEPPRSIIIRSN